jgi:proteasome accessory factor B
MAARRTERLLNLVICLLHTRSFLTAERIRELVPGYEEAPSDEAFKRMFERDKEDLRDLGIPMETGMGAYDDEIGYRVVRSDYALPDIHLEPDEAAAVGLAARMWSTATLGAPATRALRKLEAAGVEVTPLPEGLQPRADSAGVALPVIADAAREGRRVRFDYRGANEAMSAGRHVEPWGIVWWRGRWYLAGQDLDRQAPRVFRLSRIVGEPVAEGEAGAVVIPAGVDLTALVSSVDSGSAGARARLRVRRGRGIGLRREALDVTEGDDGWDSLSVAYIDADRLVEQVLPYGPDVVLLEPEEARATVIRRLEALVGSGEST